MGRERDSTLERAVVAVGGTQYDPRMNTVGSAAEPGGDGEATAGASRVHRAWLVAAITLGALVAAAAFRSSTGVLMEPLEREFGWDRTTTSGAVSLNLVLYGLTAPFAAALMERWGVKRVVASALLVVGGASGLTTVMTSAWQLWLLWGVAIGVGTGSMALVFGAIVANRWFTRHRGLVVGVFSAANATGQLVFLPVIAAAASGPGWRYAAGTVSLLALALVPAVWLWLADHPADVGAEPYGERVLAGDLPIPLAHTERDQGESPGDRGDDRDASEGASGAGRAVQRSGSVAATALRTLRAASGSWTFWALMLTFWVCGWSTNGLIQTHFVPAAHDHGMPPTTAAGLLAIVGAFDVIGTVCSGWLTDRVDARWLLGVYYALRGLSLLLLPGLLAPSVEPSLWLFIVFYGLDWVATVPPTVALCRIHFGVSDSGVVFGWVFASHMIGAGIGASVAGSIRAGHGDYRLAWLSAGGLCLIAAVAALSIPPGPSQMPQPAPARDTVDA